MRKLPVLIILLMFIGACSSNQKSNEIKNQVDPNEYLVSGTLWFQSSAEAKALYYQAYNLAKLKIDQLKKVKSKQKKAIVLDIDETVLNNSQYQGKLIVTKETYPKYWNEWLESESAPALPGAVETLNYAIKNGFDVFYISNRKVAQFDMTKRNLVKSGLPFQGDDHLLLQAEESDKTKRREVVSKTHNVVLLLGDNLNDFTGIFEKKSLEARAKLTDDNRHLFGDKFIILPNPMYGDWENSVYDYKRNLDMSEKSQIRLKTLKGF